MGPPSHRDLAARIGSRFSRRFDRHWARWKLIADPLFEAVLPWLGGGLPILDVGCGRGLLGMYLRERGVMSPYTGTDFDASKITAAGLAVKGYKSPPAYVLQDAREAWPGVQGHVCLLDVLHYVPAHEQPALLRECAAHVAERGCLVMRSGIHSSGWKQRFTSGTDKVMAACGLMKSPPVKYPTLEEITSELTGAGLSLVESRPPAPGSFFNNHVLMFRRLEEDGGRERSA